jgi:hypothetical protein
MQGGPLGTIEKFLNVIARSRWNDEAISLNSATQRLLPPPVAGSQ